MKYVLEIKAKLAKLMHPHFYVIHETGHGVLYSLLFLDYHHA